MYLGRMISEMHVESIVLLPLYGEKFKSRTIEGLAFVMADLIEWRATSAEI